MAANNPIYPGPKKAGPDGERYRLKDPAYYDYALKYCLNCKRCEVSCPSGVKIADIILKAKLSYGGKSAHPLRDRMLASTDFMGKLAVPFSPLVNGTLGLKPVKGILNAAFGISGERTFPKYAGQTFVNWYAKNAKEQQAKYSKSVTYFHGCYVNYNYPQLGKDVITLLNSLGYGVNLLEGESCCGVALASNGLASAAKRHAASNIQAMAAAKGEIISSSSSCTHNILREYPEVLELDNQAIVPKFSMLVKWLYERVESGEITLKFKPSYHKKIVYHTPCHLQRLGWQIYSISLLKMIPGVELIVLDQNCCGIAGTFGFKKEYYDYSQAIGSKLFKAIKAANAELVATDCETCKWQIEMSTGMPVANPISILAEALEI